jgi:polysaccharide pyruvyl transferase WcaK-like protein
LKNNIYVIGFYGYGNIGDEAMRLGLSDILKFKGYENIKWYSKGSSLLTDFMWADDIILGGGTHLRNWGKHWIKQDTRIFALGIAAKLLGKNFHMLNVGIEGQWLRDLIEDVADTLTIRDEQSFDSSIVLEYKQQPKKKQLGISLTPVYKIYYDDYNKDKQLANNLMNKVNEWLKNNPEHEVVFFNFNKADETLNIYASGLLKDSEFRLWQPDTIKLLEEIGECSHFIGMRYHSCQFAYKTSTPLVVINAYESCKKLASFIGVQSIDKEQILENYFELKFKKASLDISVAKSLAFGGIRI